MNIYDFVYLGKIKKEVAVKMLASSGQKYIYNPTIPEAKEKIRYPVGAQKIYDGINTGQLSIEQAENLLATQGMVLDYSKIHLHTTDIVFKEPEAPDVKPVQTMVEKSTERAREERQEGFSEIQQRLETPHVYPGEYRESDIPTPEETVEESDINQTLENKKNGIVTEEITAKLDERFRDAPYIPKPEESEILTSFEKPAEEPVKKTDLVPIALAGALLLLRSM